MRELSGGQPIEEHYKQECKGPTGIVPKEKEPGRDVTAKVFPDISREINCDNFNPDKTCEIVPKEKCVFSKTPSHQFFDHTLSHIENTPDASRTSLKDALGVPQQTTVSRIIDQLKQQGVIEDAGVIKRKPGEKGAPKIRLSTTGEQPSIPFDSYNKWEKK